MKTYEEMARDVLRRRDEELKNIQTADTTVPNDVALDVAIPAAGRKHGLKRIIIPGAAAVTAAAVGLTIWHNTGLFNSSSCESGDYRFSEFRGNPTQNPVVSEVSDYPGGKTEININRLNGFEEADYYYMMNSVPNQINPNTDDFVAIPDDEINGFYGIEFDRFTKHLDGWRVEHEPFGYYSRDKETPDTISHKSHGYYSKNMIHYYGDANTSVNVVAEFSDTPWFGKFAETDKKSLVNGFDAVIYDDGEGRFSDSVAYIRMNGVNVCISVEYVCEERFIELLDMFTKPSSDVKSVPADRVNILDRRPAELLNNDPFITGCYSEMEGLECKRMSLNDVSFYYGFYFGRLGKRYSSWKVSGTESFATYYVMDSEPGSSPRIVHDINKLYYTTDNGADVEVSATLAKLPSCVGSSYINGYRVIIFRDPDAYLASESIREHDNDTRDRFSAYIEYGNAAVKIFAVGLSDNEFVQLLKDFTSTDNADNEIVIHPKRPQEFATSKNPFFLVCGNLFDPAVFKKYTFEQLNGYDSNPMVDHITIDPEDLVKYTMEELNNYYGIEFDRLTKLHGDWEELHGNLGIYRHKFNNQENETDNMIEWTHNAIHYTLPDSSVLTVEALKERKLPDPETLYSPPPRYSTVNGCKAIIYLDDYDDNTYPNGNSIITAIIEMNGTLIRLKTAGFTEEQFLNVLDEYTK